MIDRHYVTLADGQMHYRRAGDGPPVLLLHASPMSSASLEEWITALAARATVIAPDTAGFGQSSPLPYGGEQPSIADYARRVLEFADALGLERFLIGGTHTGSKIALEVADAAPDRVGQLVMDGLGLYTADEAAANLASYTPPIEPVWHGGHLLEAWHRVRSMWMFWPWYRQESAHRLPDDLPSPDALHRMTFDLLRAYDWGLAYRAAFRYDAAAALAGSRVPAVLLAKEADPLHEHLDRLTTRPANLTVRGVPDGGHLDAMADAFDVARLGGTTPPAPSAHHHGGSSRRYVATARGTVHVRVDGDPGATPMVLLHGSPGSAASFDDLIRELARDHLVYAPDTLGNGYSTLPDVAEPEIPHFASALADVLDALGLSSVKVYGVHTGASIGLELSLQRPDLVRTLVANGLADLSPELRADLDRHYFISMAPERHGEHLIRAWHAMRDGFLYWPWYRTDRDAVRRAVVPPSAGTLHRLTMDFLTSGPSYRMSYRAAFHYPAAERLARVTVPTVVCAAPSDMLFEDSAAAVRARGDDLVRFVGLDLDRGRDAAWVVRQADTAGTRA